MPTDAEVREYEALVLEYRLDASSDLRSALAGYGIDDAAAWRDEALVVVPEIMDLYGAAVNGMTADFYDEWRAAEGVPGRFTAAPADVAALDQIEAGVRNAAGSMFRGIDADTAAALTRLDGSLNRWITAGASDTIMGNVSRDPEAAGWRRVAKGSSCAFCRMLAGRGAVYTRRGVQFKAHDHCTCSCAPSWDWNAPRPIDVAYRASERTSRMTAAEREEMRENVRAYLADMD